MKPWALLALLLVSGAAVAGKVYRWTDDQGQQHFGDRPPAEAAASVLDTTGECLAHEAPADCERRVAKARKLDEQRMQEAVKAQEKAGKSDGRGFREHAHRQARRPDDSGTTCQDRRQEIRDLDQRIRHQRHTGPDLSYLRKRLRELEWSFRKDCSPAP
jgi:hypothetical protein